MTIDLDQIQPSDELMITDNLGNIAAGPMVIIHGTMTIKIFGSHVPVATLLRGHWQPASGVKIIRHQPGLFEPPAAIKKPGRRRTDWHAS